MIVSHKIVPFRDVHNMVRVELKFSDGLKIIFVCGLIDMHAGLFKIGLIINKELSNIVNDDEQNKQILYGTYEYDDMFENDSLRDDFDFGCRYEEEKQLTLGMVSYARRARKKNFSYISDLKYRIEYDRDSSSLTIIEKKIIISYIDKYTWRDNKENIIHLYKLSRAQKKRFCRILGDIYRECNKINEMRKACAMQIIPFFYHPLRLDRLARKRGMEFVDFIEVYERELSLDDSESTFRYGESTLVESI